MNWQTTGVPNDYTQVLTRSNYGDYRLLRFSETRGWYDFFPGGHSYVAPEFWTYFTPPTQESDEQNDLPD
jgi:hypothetical protein